MNHTKRIHITIDKLLIKGASPAAGREIARQLQSSLQAQMAAMPHLPIGQQVQHMRLQLAQNSIHAGQHARLAGQKIAQNLATSQPTNAKKAGG